MLLAPVVVSVVSAFVGLPPASVTAPVPKPVPVRALSAAPLVVMSPLFVATVINPALPPAALVATPLPPLAVIACTKIVPVAFRLTAAPLPPA